MKELYPIFGIVTVLNTPFKQDDTIDLQVLKNKVLDTILPFDHIHQQIADKLIISIIELESELKSN